MAHYHLYKAAGTTVTLTMRRHFGGRFSELDKSAEFKNVAAYNIEFFKRTAAAHPRLVAMSAHRVVPNIHMAKSLEVFPIVFIRHPLLRAASVWRFDRKRKADGSGKAEALTREFPAWIDWCLQPDRLIECRNYQSRMLSLPDDGGILCCREGEVIRGDLSVAIDRLDAMPVVGVVEDYDRSVAAINAAAQKLFPGFAIANAKVNVTKVVVDWQAELSDLEASLPPLILERFYQANDDDLALWTRYRAALATAQEKRWRKWTQAKPDGGLARAWMGRQERAQRLASAFGRFAAFRIIQSHRANENAQPSLIRRQAKTLRRDGIGQPQ